MSGNKLSWLTAGGAVIALLAVVFGTQLAGTRHPDPRPGVGADLVLPPGAVPRTPGALEAYAAARSAPALLDGIYCHCQCRENFGHRSLLTCFESDHGANCDVCMGEAMMALQLGSQGQSLREIRRAIDRQFKS